MRTEVTRSLVLGGALALTLLALGSPLRVRAQEGDAAEASPARAVLPVFIAADVPLDRAVVVEAFDTMPALGLALVRDELEPSVAGVRVEAAGSEVRVRYRRASGPELTRTLALPPGAAQAAEAVALVIINLVHDEAVDLLSLLAPAGEEGPAADAVAVPRPVDATEPAATTRAEPSAQDDTEPTAQDQPSTAATLEAATATAFTTTEGAVLEQPRLVPERTACRERANHGRVGVDVLPMLGTSSFRSLRHAVRGFSLNLAGGLSRGLHGVEIGGALNVQRDFACGLQIAGGLNVVLGPVQGLQIAPVNIALGRVDGVQLGVVNIAREVRGLQLGLVNVSRDAAAPIGLLSIVTNGRTELNLTVSEGMIVAGVSHGGRIVHNIYGVGIRLSGKEARPVVFAGLGARLFTRRRVSLDLDGIAHWILRVDSDPQSSLVQLRLSLEVRAHPRVGVFLAPTYSWFFSNREDERTQTPRVLVTTYREFSEVHGRILGWPGFNVGVRLHLREPSR